MRNGRNASRSLGAGSVQTGDVYVGQRLTQSVVVFDAVVDSVSAGRHIFDLIGHLIRIGIRVGISIGIRRSGTSNNII